MLIEAFNLGLFRDLIYLILRLDWKTHRCWWNYEYDCGPAECDRVRTSPVPAWGRRGAAAARLRAPAGLSGLVAVLGPGKQYGYRHTAASRAAACIVHWGSGWKLWCDTVTDNGSILQLRIVSSVRKLWFVVTGNHHSPSPGHWVLIWWWTLAAIF